jgi:hypothetical protein
MYSSLDTIWACAMHSPREIPHADSRVYPGSVSLRFRVQRMSLCLSTTPWRQYERVSKSFRTGHLERELQMVQFFATRCSCIAILWVSLVSFATITLCVASEPVFIAYFVIDLVRKLFDTPLYGGVEVPLNAFLTSALNRGERSASRLFRFIPSLIKHRTMKSCG